MSQNENNILIYFALKYNLKNLINALDELKVYFKDNEMIESYEEEKKDFNKFIIIISAIINLDADNYDEIIKIAIIFKSPTSEIINSGLTYIKPNIKKNMEKKPLTNS